MVTSLVPSDRSTSPDIKNPNITNLDTAETGWRYAELEQADGSIATIQIPLTSEEFLHPKEGYYLPNSTFHDDMTATARDILTRRYAQDENIAVYSDLIIVWDDPDLKDNCPDVMVIFAVQDKGKRRGKFFVDQEGVQPRLIIEVVSPHYRREDREIKVVQYAKAGVPEYLIIDQRRHRGQLLEEVLGYRLVGGIYQPISPDEEGRVLAATVGLWFSLRDGELIIEDRTTRKKLPNSLELEAQTRELAIKNQALESENESLRSQLLALQAQRAPSSME